MIRRSPYRWFLAYTCLLQQNPEKRPPLSPHLNSRLVLTANPPCLITSFLYSCKPTMPAPLLDLLPWWGSNGEPSSPPLSVGPIADGHGAAVAAGTKGAVASVARLDAVVAGGLPAAHHLPSHRSARQLTSAGRLLHTGGAHTLRLRARRSYTAPSHAPREPSHAPAHLIPADGHGAAPLRTRPLSRST